jgi:hypothetical protein
MVSEDRSTGLPDADLPHGWSWLDATTPAGFIYVSMWREFGQVSELEAECAVHAPLGSPNDLLAVARTKSLAGNAVVTVRAMREARAQRPDLTTDQWERLIRRSWHHLTPQQRMSPRELLAEMELTHPTPPRRAVDPLIAAESARKARRPGPELIVTSDQVKECRAALRASGKPHGYRAVAAALAVSVSTVRRRLTRN